MRVRLTVVALAAAVGLGQPASAQLRDTLAGAYLAGQSAAARNDSVEASRYLAAVLLRDPQNAPVAELALQHQLIAGLIPDAERSAERLLQVEPSHRMANMVLAARDIRRGRFEAVRERLVAVPEGFHPLAAAMFDAWAAYGAGDAAAADAALTALGDTGLLGAFGGFHRGLLLLAQGRADEALAVLDAVRTTIGARSARIIAAEGLALQALGRVEEAASLYAEFAGEPALDAAAARLAAGAAPQPLVGTASEGVAEALFGLAGLMTGDDDRRSGLAHARLALSLRPDLEAATMLAAGMFSAEGKHRMAADLLAAIPENSPNALRARIAQAEAQQGLDDLDAARATLSALAERHPERAEVHIALGDLLRRTEAWLPCAEAYTAAVDLLRAADRLNWPLLYQRGICNERGGLWDAAEADFKAALDLEPDQPLVLNYLGYSWVELGRHLEEAKAMIERAVEQRPDDGFITDSLGWVLYRMGDHEGAVEWLEKAVELEPTDPILNDHLGDALWMVGRRMEARFQWKRARSFDPTEKDLARIRRKLEVGLDVVLEEERAATPAAAEAAQPTATVPKPNGG